MPIIGTGASHGMSARLKPVVTGGTLSSDSTYYYRTFTGSSNFTVTGPSLTVDVLVVAGGGNGAYARDFAPEGGNIGAGGGGAGGVISFSNQVLSANTYAAAVGGGSAQASFSRASGSQFGSLTAAIGGGRGVGWDQSYNSSMCDGGSGGGGGSRYIAGSFTTPGSSLGGQGNAGGTGFVAPSADTSRGGGGGGSESTGQNGGNNSGGNGGNGTSSFSSWASATGTGVSSRYAAGGAGIQVSGAG